MLQSGGGYQTDTAELRHPEKGKTQGGETERQEERQSTEQRPKETGRARARNGKDIGKKTGLMGDVQDRGRDRSKGSLCPHLEHLGETAQLF